MNNKNNLVSLALDYGYEKKGYGYKKVTKNNTHWITFFDEDSLQMYAYFTIDEEMGKIYDTGIVRNITSGKLETLIQVLISNNN